MPVELDAVAPVAVGEDEPLDAFEDIEAPVEPCGPLPPCALVAAPPVPLRSSAPVIRLQPATTSSATAAPPACAAASTQPARARPIARFYTVSAFAVAFDSAPSNAAGSV